MAVALSEKRIRELVEEAEHEMGDLGIDPTHKRAWMELAFCLINDRHQIAPSSSEDGEEFKISKESYDRLMYVAGAATRLIAVHKQLESSYLDIDKPAQLDALEYAIAALEMQEDLFDKMGVSRFGGLPTPLRLVLADLINVFEGRLGRLISPDDRIIKQNTYVADSANDRIRLTIHAYAAHVVHQLIQSYGRRKNQRAYSDVAKILATAGFTAPGKDTPVKPSTVRGWYEASLSKDCLFYNEYKQAAKATAAEPKELLFDLESIVRSHMFHR